MKVVQESRIGDKNVDDCIKVECKAITRAVTDVNSSPSGSLLAVARLLAG